MGREIEPRKGIGWYAVFLIKKERFHCICVIHIAQKNILFHIESICILRTCVCVSLVCM
jgi:hypothetical protein